MNNEDDNEDDEKIGFGDLGYDKIRDILIPEPEKGDTIFTLNGDSVIFDVFQKDGDSGQWNAVEVDGGIVEEIAVIDMGMVYRPSLEKLEEYFANKKITPKNILKYLDIYLSEKIEENEKASEEGEKIDSIIKRLEKDW